MLVEWARDQETPKKWEHRGAEPPFSFRNAWPGGFSLPCPDTPHPGERGEWVVTGRLTASQGRRTVWATHQRIGRRPTHTPLQGERQGSSERRKEGRKREGTIAVDGRRIKGRWTSDSGALFRQPPEAPTVRGENQVWVGAIRVSISRQVKSKFPVLTRPNSPLKPQNRVL